MENLGFLGIIFVVVLAAWYLNNISGEAIFTHRDLTRFLRSIRPFWRLLLSSSFVGAVSFYLLFKVPSRTPRTPASGFEAALALLLVPGSAMTAYFFWYMLSKREIETSQFIIGIFSGLAYAAAMTIIVLIGVLLGG